MDIRMPVMDGIQAMEKICTMSFAVPIIAVMAYAFYTEQQAIQAGCNAVISKPYSMEKLRETIDSYIGWLIFWKGINIPEIVVLLR